LPASSLDGKEIFLVYWGYEKGLRGISANSRAGRRTGRRYGLKGFAGIKTPTEIRRVNEKGKGQTTLLWSGKGFQKRKDEGGGIKRAEKKTKWSQVIGTGGRHA